MSRNPKVTNEMKKFISDSHLAGQAKSELVTGFEAKFGFTPSSRVMNKWKNYSETPDPDEETDTGGEGGEGDLEVETDDTRTQKELVDISGDEVDDAAFNKLCRTFALSRKDLWDTLVKAKNQGYKKVNPVTGEFTK